LIASAETSNGKLLSAPTDSVYPVPGVSNAEKSIRCTESPDAASAPFGVVWPLATAAPAEFLRVHVCGAVAVETRVARLGRPGTYPTWSTWTFLVGVGLPPPGGFTPPIIETLSTQIVLSDGWPPSWKATWPLPASGKSNVDVKVNVKRCLAVVTAKSCLAIPRYGLTLSPAAAATVCAVVARASNDRV
jgi:hypothetical protein